jgi:GTP-binding protein EngB required for normal cell division
MDVLYSPHRRISSNPNIHAKAGRREKMDDEMETNIDEIALVGGTDAGKTSFMAAVYAEFCSRPQFEREEIADIIADLEAQLSWEQGLYDAISSAEEFREIKREKKSKVEYLKGKIKDFEKALPRNSGDEEGAVRSAVPVEFRDVLASFVIKSFPNAEDEKFIVPLAERMRLNPIKYPPGSRNLPEVFSFDADFVLKSQNKGKECSNVRRLSLVDVAGEFLNPKNPAKDMVAQAKERLLSCYTFIIFIDTQRLLRQSDDEDEDSKSKDGHIIEHINNIVVEATTKAKRAGDPERLITVSVVFTKFDLIAADRRKAVADHLFKLIGIAISDSTPNVLVMTCPIAIQNQNNKRMKAYNLHFPFLFAAMGVIQAKAWEADQLAEKAASEARLAKLRASNAQDEAESAKEKAIEEARYADYLRRSGGWERFKMFFSGKQREADRTARSQWSAADAKKRRAREMEEEASARENLSFGTRREAISEHELAAGIYKYLCVEGENPENLIRFARNGKKTTLQRTGGYVEEDQYAS